MTTSFKLYKVLNTSVCDFTALNGDYKLKTTALDHLTALQKAFAIAKLDLALLTK